MAQACDVVILGKGSLAITVSDYLMQCNRFSLLGVVPVTPEPPWTASLHGWATENQVPVLSLREITTKADGFFGLGISVFFDEIFSEATIRKFVDLINVHNAPLPRYRGVNPINWALKNGESMHGVTIHEIAPGVDEGPILGQSTFSIDPDKDEVIDIYERCLEEGSQLMTTVLSRWPFNQRAPQDHERATYYARLDAPKLGDRAGFTRK